MGLSDSVLHPEDFGVSYVDDIAIKRTDLVYEEFKAEVEDLKKRIVAMEERLSEVSD